MFKKHNYQRSDWIRDGDRWADTVIKDLHFKLEGDYLNILRQITARTLQVRAIHSCIRGQKDARSLLSNISSNGTATESCVKKFNDSLQKLPDHISKKINLPALTFDYKALSLTETNILYGFEALRIRGISCLSDESLMWARSNELRQAKIRLYLQIERADKDIELLKAEYARLFR